MKRGQTNLNFLIGINKPKDVTSHDVVNSLRHITGEGRIGHMGTLDPMATGVMLVGIGSAARLNNYIESHDKSYLATITFGKTTNTFDAQGQVIQTFDVPEKIYSKDFAKEYLSGIVGKRKQRPPSFSAIKIDGKPAYKQARKGIDVEISQRDIDIYSAELVDINKNCWVIRLEVSKGTYIRSIAHEIGQELKCGAYLSDLIRESIGAVNLDDCYTLEEFEQAFNDKKFRIINASEILGFDVIEADKDMKKRIKNGRSLGMDKKWNMFPGSKISLIDHNKLLAIYRADTLIDLNCECKFAQAIFTGPEVCLDNLCQ